MPHDIEVRELGTGKSRREAAEKLGISPIRVVPMLPIDDGINAVRMMFPRLWFNADRCVQGLRCLRNYRAEYSDRLGEKRRVPLHDWSSHGADAFRSLAVVVDRLRLRSGKKTMTDDECNFYLAMRERDRRAKNNRRDGLRMA
jgi:hypothetical protein